jgi:hypothetical protein
MATKTAAIPEPIPKTWNEFLGTLPLTLRDKLSKTSAKAVDTVPSDFVNGTYAGTYLVVTEPSEQLRDEEKSVLLKEAAVWFNSRFRIPHGKRYRGLVFVDEKLIVTLLSSPPVSIVSVRPDWGVTSIEEYERC